jgi:hypothetical protein
MRILIHSAPILTLFAMLAIGCSGSRVGNPKSPGRAIVQLEIAANLNASVTQLNVCPTSARFVSPSGSSYDATLAAGEVSVSQSKTSLSSLEIPEGDYDRIELQLSSACASQKSIQVTNTHGSYSAADSVTLKFNGAFGAAVGATRIVNLEIQPIVTQLSTVSSDSQVKSAAESATGGATVSCPSGYVAIPAVSGYTASEFCVGKYEAKNSGSVAVSQAAGAPWVSVTRAAAATACAANGTGYSLITHNHWQAIARSIESVTSNWSGGTVGSSGGLSHGHSDNVPSNTLAADANDADGCDGTGEVCDALTWNDQRRTHVLPNGGVIWDFSGNVWEWLLEDDAGGYGPDNYISEIIDPTTKQKWGPSGDYSALANPWGGLGYGTFSLGAGAVIRGASYSTTVTQAGVFAVEFAVNGAVGYLDVGFRCVYQP